ncbi:pyruvate:ferredoxin (flavodoxin) oxidoreductase [Endozoicomonas ascidiicola]|uniref:pyruvate:ferredoxin (flavodoxin) oxidoreductase n=1 Tax=Endozoicomonas ascidiicola TaxID=1698521 RepID=UPI000B053B6A|nr:pyruvate:ferredoxin (flavodoxin) oxidoreductase [Endozoicomonas ascidiicola]
MTGSVNPRLITIDANEAVASVAYRCNDVIGIYPITPSSPMSEACEIWESQDKANCWGVVPRIMEMQSEGGAAGVVHGALMAGAMATSFTSSQGLLLKIPNMYKIAGELTPFVMHVAARTLATHALSIFCDHSDVMAARQTGFAMLCSSSVQQAHDFALISQAATLESRIPFMHFFDGFRTSHEVNKIAWLEDDDIRSMVDQKAIDAFKSRALSPDNPTIRGTAQNPDVFFQAREAINPFYMACPDTVAAKMAQFEVLTGRKYRLFDYYGHPEADNVVVIMGSAAHTVHQAVDELLQLNSKVGVLVIHLYRPFSLKHFLEVLPESVKNIAVMDRTKEPGALGEPLYLDVVTAVAQAGLKSVPVIAGGRYGLSSKEFTPEHAKAVFAAMQMGTLKHNFTVGITDDVTGLSLPVASFCHEPERQLSAIFYGLGSDGTVGANKNTLKIIGEQTPLNVQGYFVYDSKKSGSVTVSHLRVDQLPIEAPYLIQEAGFIACHQFDFIFRLEMFEQAVHGATLLLNSPYSADAVWRQLPREVQTVIVERQLKLYVIDAAAIAQKLGLGKHQNIILQTAFFAISQILPMDEARDLLKTSIAKSYAKAGPAKVLANQQAVDESEQHLQQVEIPALADSTLFRTPVISEHSPEFVEKVTALILANKGDTLPVSAFPIDGSWPTATSQWERRSITAEIPQWNPDHCNQCAQCSLMCPHGAIRSKLISHEQLEGAPESFATAPYQYRDFSDKLFTLQVSPDHCTGCGVCTRLCTGNSKGDTLTLKPKAPIVEKQREHYDFIVNLPDLDRIELKRIDGRNSQLLRPLFEYSGACSGCGETPYIKLLTQLFGDRLMIANATGCSSIYGGNLPTTPYAQNDKGQGPAWANSLFEDNAEFGLGLRLASSSRRDYALQQLKSVSGLSEEQKQQVMQDAFDGSDAAVSRQRNVIQQLLESDNTLQGLNGLVEKSHWIVGGDGWAYDIGFGGLDHVLASGENVNVLVMDNQVYANTGGQQSKATPTGAVARFATRGKSAKGKDLAMSVMLQGGVYVARVAMGANINQTLKALQEAAAYPGPSLVIAYAACITHGIDMSCGIEHQQQMVDTGMWPLYRFDPKRFDAGKAALQMDSRAPKKGVQELLASEARFNQIQRKNPEQFEHYVNALQQQVQHQHHLLSKLQEWK